MTATRVAVSERRFVVDAGIGQDLLVSPSGNKDEVSLADGTGPVIGPTLQETYNAGDGVTVRLMNTPGTQLGIASEAIGMHADVFAAAGGKLAATGTVKVGRSLDAATADGDRIEYLPFSAVAEVTAP